MTDLHALPRVCIALVGEDGNAFAILGRWQHAARMQGWPKDAIGEVMKRATAGNYDALLATIVEFSEEPDTDDGDDVAKGDGE